MIVVVVVVSSHAATKDEDPSTIRRRCDDDPIRIRRRCEANTRTKFDEDATSKLATKGERPLLGTYMISCKFITHFALVTTKDTGPSATEITLSVRVIEIMMFMLSVSLQTWGSLLVAFWVSPLLHE